MSWIQLIGVVLLACAVTLAIVWLVDRLRGEHGAVSDDDRVGVKIGAAFGVYGIILGFAVVIAQQTYTDAAHSLQNEMGAVVSVVNMAHALPDGQGEPILLATRAYLESEVASWNSVDQQLQVDSPSVAALRRVYEGVQALSINPGDAAAQSAMFQALTQVDSGRMSRIRFDQTSSTMFMWLLLVGGAIIVTAMAALLRFESRRLRLLLLLSMSCLIAIAVFTTWAFSSPFGGPVPIDSQPLEHVLGRI